jgi:hypothetical protein
MTEAEWLACTWLFHRRRTFASVIMRPHRVPAAFSKSVATKRPACVS